MRLIDMHCDTIFELSRKKNQNLKSNSLCVDIEKMRDGKSLAQFFACFIYMKNFEGNDRWDRGYQQGLDMISYAKGEFEKNKEDIRLATSYEDFLENEREGKISAFLTVEEGGIIDSKMDNLNELFKQGVRLITLTWNEENCIGFPNSRDKTIMKSGLKSFGIEVVEHMNKLGMIIDVSHLSDGGFWDVIKHSKKSIVASHSNVRELCNHPRNLSDEMIRVLADNGGIAGLNFYSFFVNQSGKSCVEDLVRHIEHMYRIGGEEVVAIGTDFDGFQEGETQIKHIGQMDMLYGALKKFGFSERQLDKFWNGNARRIIKENLVG